MNFCETASKKIINQNCAQTASNYFINFTNSLWMSSVYFRNLSSFSLFRCTLYLTNLYMGKSIIIIPSQTFINPIQILHLPDLYFLPTNNYLPLNYKFLWFPNLNCVNFCFLNKLKANIIIFFIIDVFDFRNY